MSRFAERARKGIARCTMADLDEVRAFQQRMYGLADEIPTASLDWLFTENPNRAADDGLGLWICRRDGHIVGQQAELTVTVHAGDDDITATAAIELMVEDAWRLKGVGHALSQLQQEGTPLAVSLGMSDDAAKMYTRRGWSNLGVIDEHLFVLSSMVAPRLVRTDRTRTAAKAMIPALAAFVAAATATAKARRRGTTLVPIRRFDEWADRVWDLASPSFAVLARRDATSLHWRYDRSPHAGLYRRYYLVHRGLPVGYVVLRPSAWRGARSLKIVDYLAGPGFIDRLLAHCVGVAHAEGAAVVQLRTRNPAATPRIRSLGFLPAAPNVRFMVAARDDVAQHDLLVDPAAWFVTSGDADLEFVELSRVELDY